MRTCLFKANYLVIVAYFTINFCGAQSAFNITNPRGVDRIKFQLINNLIIIPVEVNGVELSFILDSGVNKTILFNVVNEAYKIKNSQKISLNGLGGGEPMEAVQSFNNIVKIGDAIKINQELYVIFDESLNLSPRFGVPIHGIIGYDLFENLIVEVGYSSKTIRLSNFEDYKAKRCNKCLTFPIEFHNNKPYINGNAFLNDQTIPVKLLIDSGGSDAIWLFEDEAKGVINTLPFYHDFLGQGLNGSVYGKRSKIKRFSLGAFDFEHVNVSYPDSLTVQRAKQFTSRNGSLGGEILKRFNIIFDYKGNTVQLKKNRNYSNSFLYNLSGIELQHSGMRLVRERNEQTGIRTTDNDYGANTAVTIIPSYNLALKPRFTIAELRLDSPAYKAGLKIHDEIITINGNQTYRMALHEITGYFFDKPGKIIRVKINRDGLIKDFQFKLETILK